MLRAPRRLISGPFRATLASRVLGAVCLFALLLLPVLAHAQDADRERAALTTRRAATLTGERITPAATAVVNFGALARAEALHLIQSPAVQPRMLENNQENEDGAEPEGGVMGSLQSLLMVAKPISPFAASPAPANSFIGLDDIPMADSSYIVIPPDVSGAVGLTKVMQGSNNNYRILDKTTGAVLATLGTATFWAPVVAVAERASLTDPRMVYDPYNNRWLAAMQTTTTGAGKMLIGVSQTSDPQGAWFLYSFNTGATIDYPILGFNKNWVSCSINKYNASNAFTNGINLVLNYPLALTGTASTTLFSLAASSGFCVAPCHTYSTTADTLYAIAHLSSAGASFALDFISGTAAAPVYHQGGTLTRTGGGWAQPSGNKLPQSNPNAGSSACSPACPLETQDSYVRSSPSFRGGIIYYAQTVGLPAGTLTHTAAQWTKITTPSGAFVDGGRLEDPTATATNGGKWYSTVHVAANAAGDFMLGFSQFSSAQHPSAGYAVHLAADAASSIRDAQIYKAGDDYYHKTFSTATGRNRWGDFSTAQVDPSDDTSMWALQEYAKARAATDDGNTGSNSSKWGTYWAKMTPAAATFTINASAGANGGISPSGAVSVASGANQGFTITPAANYHVLDVLVDGSSVGAVTTYNFTNVLANHTISATFAINTFTITASAGANGSITPSGAVGVNAAASQGFTITPSANYHVLDVLVDGSSVGAVTTYNFANVLANHTISASFAIDSYTIRASSGLGGSIAPSGNVAVNAGANQAFVMTADTGYHLADVLVDGSSVGAVTNYNFTNVLANHQILASFALDAHALAITVVGGGSVTKSPNQASYDYGTPVTLTAVPAVGFAFVGWSGDTTTSSNPLSIVVTANHAYTATFADTAAPTVTVTAPNGGENLGVGTHANLTWTAGDNVGVTAIDLFLSRAGAGGPFDSIATNQSNTGSYDWIVTGPLTSTAFLKIVAHDVAGNVTSDLSDAAFAITGTLGVSDGPVTEFALSPVVPNPTRGLAHVTFALPRAARVHIGVLDVQGREVLTLAEGEYGAGRHQTQVTAGHGMMPGLYFVRMTTAGHTFVKRFAVMQ